MTIPLIPAAPVTDDLSKISAATVNAWRANLAKCLDGVGGSNGVPSTPSTKLELHGSGLELGGATAPRLQYASRTLTRAQTGMLTNSSGAIGQSAVTVAPGATGFQMLDRLPNGSTLTTVTVYHDRVNLGALPTTRVSVTLRKRRLSTGVNSVVSGPTIDPTSVLADYEAHHSFELTSISEVVNNTDYVYWIEFSGESGANTSSTTLFACLCTVIVTDQDEAP
jgi:hypothetical protein